MSVSTNCKPLHGDVVAQVCHGRDDPVKSTPSVNGWTNNYRVQRIEVVMEPLKENRENQTASFRVSLNQWFSTLKRIEMYIPFECKVTSAFVSVWGEEFFHMKPESSQMGRWIMSFEEGLFTNARELPLLLLPHALEALTLTVHISRISTPTTSLPNLHLAKNVKFYLVGTLVQKKDADEYTRVYSRFTSSLYLRQTRSVVYQMNQNMVHIDPKTLGHCPILMTLLVNFAGFRSGSSTYPLRVYSIDVVHRGQAEETLANTFFVNCDFSQRAMGSNNSVIEFDTYRRCGNQSAGVISCKHVDVGEKCMRCPRSIPFDMELLDHDVWLRFNFLPSEGPLDDDPNRTCTITFTELNALDIKEFEVKKRFTRDVSYIAQ